MPVPKANLHLSLKHILYTTDFSAPARAAMPYAEALAKWYDSELVLAHAVEPEPPLGVPMDPLPVQADLYWNDAQKRMADLQRSFPLRGVKHTVQLKQGETWQVISELIENLHIDLLVMGTHGHAGLKKLVLGSAAERIFRLASCPVLTVGPNARNGRPFDRFSRIVFATDFSMGSLQALPYALSLAEENLADLILLHLIPLVPLSEEEALRESTQARLQRLIPPGSADWCQPEFITRFEFPQEGILRLANEKNADLIVMGVKRSRAPRAVSHLPWTTAYEVVCRAHCPVLTVRG